MNEHKLVVVVNEAAGGGRCGKEAAQALSHVEAYRPVHILKTQGPGHATELAQGAFKRGHRQFLAVGGDGTAFEVLNGLFPQAINTPIQFGILPLGTGNSFLRDFHSGDLPAALAALARGATRSVDVVRLTHETGELFFLNLCTLGFAAQVGLFRNRYLPHWGTSGYILAVFACLFSHKPMIFPIRYEDQQELDQRPCSMISFSNSKYTGGAMLMAPTADTSDGQVDVVRFGGLGRFRLLAHFPKIFSGSHVQLAEVEQRKVHHLDLWVAHPIPVLIDGEVRFLTPKRLEVLDQAIQLWA